MDERGWFTATKPQSLFLTACRNARPRKVSLCLCACIRQFWERIPESSFQVVVDVCERVADQVLPPEDITAVYQIIRAFPYHETNNWRAYNAVLQLVSSAPNTWRVMWEILQVIRDQPGRQRLCMIVRDVFGNPFRPVSVSAEWRTDTVLTLARTMYESREFGAMPILADALQDAGCDRDDVLNHCRDTNHIHVRGCWVVDLVLGKA